MRIPILTDLCKRWLRYKRYKEIIKLHNEINEYRIDLKDLEKASKAYPEAASHRDKCRSQLELMYINIGWKMRRYRQLYPKRGRK